jgi:hypothetical protein
LQELAVEVAVVTVLLVLWVALLSVDKVEALTELELLVL